MRGECWCGQRNQLSNSEMKMQLNTGSKPKQSICKPGQVTREHPKVCNRAFHRFTTVKPSMGIGISIPALPTLDPN